MAVFTNWLSFKRYFLANPTARAILALSALVIAGSFAPLPAGDEEGASPPVLALQAVTKAPLAQVAPLTGRSADVLLADLKQAGIALNNADQSLDSVLKGDRELTGAAMRVLFGAPN